LSTAQAIVEDEVRELVRRRGIDPVAEGGAVRQLVDEVVDDYRDRAVTAALPPLGDPSHITRRVVDAVAGFGPLQPFLDDPEIEEIWINEPGRVFVARRGRSELTTLILTSDAVADLVERMLRSSGRRIDLSTPLVVAHQSQRRCRSGLWRPNGQPADSSRTCGSASSGSATPRN
jgi:pilus assembly protein CpaF